MPRYIFNHKSSILNFQWWHIWNLWCLLVWDTGCGKVGSCKLNTKTTEKICHSVPIVLNNSHRLKVAHMNDLSPPLPRPPSPPSPPPSDLAYAWWGMHSSKEEVSICYGSKLSQMFDALFRCRSSIQIINFCSNIAVSSNLTQRKPNLLIIFVMSWVPPEILKDLK